MSTPHFWYGNDTSRSTWMNNDPGASRLALGRVRSRGIVQRVPVLSWGMIEKTDIAFGPASANRLSETADPSIKGAEAALESFYYSLNNRDIEALRAGWAADPLAQLNNPVGGILRGGDAIARLYEHIFNGHVNVQVTFGDVVAYLGERHAVFAGREIGSYTAADAVAVPLEIRTSRYFRYETGHWRQYHHHGSIDDPDALRAYQRAIRGS